MKTTKVFDKLIDALKTHTIVASKGSTSSSKTISTLQAFHSLAELSEKPRVFTVASETMPHLKLGAMRDYFSLLLSYGLYNPKNHNKTDHNYKVGKSIIEFVALDNPGKAHGSRRDFLYLNEAPNISWEIADQMMARTREKTVIDWNPSHEFWYQTEKINLLPFCKEIHSTYLDNQYLDENTIRYIESKKPVYDSAGNLISGNENWWRVYGLGLDGMLEGSVYTNWDLVDGIPQGARSLGGGLDFGFVNSKNALLDVYEMDGELYVDEIIHRTGLHPAPIKGVNGKTEENIHDEAVARGYNIKKLTVCDSAEPKSIAALVSMGWNVVPVVKGNDGIKYGIQSLSSRKIHITKRSLGTIKDFRNYKYIKGKETPDKSFDDAPDALRYLALKVLKVEKSFSWLNDL